MIVRKDVDMERLTKRCNENSVGCTHFGSKECSEVLCECAHGCKWEEEAWEKLAEYEDLEEQGLLLRLPYNLETCGVIYYVDEKDSEIYRLTADKIEISKMMISRKFILTIDSFDFFIEDFGKTVFLTRTEAEEALRRMEEKVAE